MPFHFFIMQLLVVANPANTNALILKEFAPSILEENITCLTRLDHNRALSQIAERLKVYVTDVKNVIIWGNHSSTQYPDVNHAIVTTTNGERPVKELDTEDHWVFNNIVMLTIFTSLCILVRLFTLLPFLLFIYLNFVCHGLKNEFINTIQQRGAAIIKAQKASSALSATSATCNHMHDWVLGTPKDLFVFMEYLELLLKGLVVSCPIAFYWMLITYKWSFRKIEKEQTKVLVTGVVDEALNGIKMELIDAAFPLLKGVISTTDIVEACKDVNIAVMLGGFPRKEGMERTDMMSKNVSMYMAQALALGKHAAADCKVLVFAKPSNTNALILKEFAPSIPEKNITCLTRLDHNRALSQIAKRLKHCGLAIIKARKASSALSAASAACDHILDWVFKTPKERGFPWEFVLMVLMGSNLALLTLFLLNVRMENGQLCRIERERERERVREKNLEGGAVCRSRNRSGGSNDDLQRFTKKNPPASTIYKVTKISFHFSDSEREREKERNTLREGRREHRSRGRSPICDEGRATTATTSELRRRGDVTVGLLGFGFYLCIGDFFFLDKNLSLSVFSEFLSVFSVFGLLFVEFGLLLSLICSV
uniref:malate dehydrogenase n=1 Tax=Quercus lobata TaxID=97700 RepID=A0A7N2LFN9_QUELO